MGKRVKRGEIYTRTSSKGNKVRIRQLKKKDVLNSKREESINIDVCKLLPNKKVHLKRITRKNFKSREKFKILTYIFDEVMEKILENMIEQKNIYKFPNRAKLIIGEMDTRKGVLPFFTYDTTNIYSGAIANAESNGYAWRIIPGKIISDKLDYYSRVKKEKYIKCNSLIGKQLLASYRGKLSSLTLKLKKKGLSHLYLRQL